MTTTTRTAAEKCWGCGRPIDERRVNRAVIGSVDDAEYEGSVCDPCWDRIEQEMLEEEREQRVISGDFTDANAK